MESTFIHSYHIHIPAGQNPPIQEVVSLGCLPKFVEFLQDSSSPTLQVSIVRGHDLLCTGNTLCVHYYVNIIGTSTCT